MPEIAGNRYVVVGGASLIGSHIAERLLQEGAAKVCLFDNLSLGSFDGIDALLGDRCSFVRGDALRTNELYDAFAGMNGVFSVVGYLGMPMQSNPWAGLDVNVRGIQNVFEVARYQGIEKVIYSSSVGLYGSTDEAPVDETTPFHWEGLSSGMALYGATKVIGEAIALHSFKSYGLPAISLRYCTVYGERLHARGFTAVNLRQNYDSITAGRAPVMPGDGSQVFDYLYAGDAARANLMAMESEVSHDAFNIVTGIDTSIARIAELCAEACGSDLKPVRGEGAVEHVSSATPRLGYSREKAKRLLGWEPRVDVREGVGRLMAWFATRR